MGRVLRRCSSRRSSRTSRGAAPPCSQSRHNWSGRRNWIAPLACRAAGRAAARRIVKATTCVKLLLAAREYERCTAIAARERFVCVLHADSRKKEVVEVITSRTGYVGAPWLTIVTEWTEGTEVEGVPRVAPKHGSRKLRFPATRQYTCPRQAPLHALFDEFLAKPFAAFEVLS